ncbi:hypothetical protein RUND412_010831, partial [Rhizina undulata]
MLTDRISRAASRQKVDRLYNSVKYNANVLENVLESLEGRVMKLKQGAKHPSPLPLAKIYQNNPALVEKVATLTTKTADLKVKIADLKHKHSLTMPLLASPFLKRIDVAPIPLSWAQVIPKKAKKTTTTANTNAAPATT